MWKSLIIYVLATITITRAADCSWCKAPDIVACGATTTKDWTLVRAIGPSKGSWFNNRDSLQGTDSAVDNNADQFNIGSFETAVAGFNQYLFVTGDCSLFLTTSKDAIGGPMNNQYYGNAQRNICSSSEQQTAYTAAWYNRNGAIEDPWISTIDHGPAIRAGKIVYGENNFGSTHAATVVKPKGGVYIFIRNGGTLDAKGCATDPCAGKDCDNGQYCDGEEYCDPKDGECKPGENIQCKENMRCDNKKAKCVRDCKSFAIDEYLVQCSDEHANNEEALEDLASGVFSNKEKLGVVDEKIDGIYDKIKHLHARIDGYQPVTTKQADAIFVDYNGLDAYKDTIIIVLFIMNMVTMIGCYMYSRKDKKYQVVSIQESDDEERSLKR